MLLFSSEDYYDVLKTPVARVGLVIGDGTPVSVLAKLDEKIDDGYPRSGVIRYVTPNEGTFGAFSQSDENCVDAVRIPPVWITSNPQKKCNGIHLY